MSQLSHLLTSGNIPHALLFTGGQLAERARQFVVDLIGKYPHPDVHEYFPEGKTGMHPISALRQLTSEVGFVPYQAKWKVFMIHEAERMLPTSGNALLKTFEEPTDRTLIILLSQHPERILPTILSRCQRVDFPSESEVPRHKILSVLAGESDVEDDFVSEGLFETVLLWYRDRHLLELGCGERFLAYPEYRDRIQQAPLIPLERVEEALGQARLGLERSMKLTTCLEALFYQLS